MESSPKLLCLACAIGLIARAVQVHRHSRWLLVWMDVRCVLGSGVSREGEEELHGAAGRVTGLWEGGHGYAWHLLADSCWLESSPRINLRR